MIPDELIEKAAEAAANTPVHGECPTRIRLADMHPDDAQAWRNAARAVIAAVGASIWKTGYNFGSSDEITRALGIITDDQRTPNPYRQEHA